MAYQSSTNLYNTSKYIVDAAGGTPYTTIQSALDAANAAGGNVSVFVRKGTYTEDLTLYNSVYIKGVSNFIGYATTGNVIILGNHNLPGGVLDIAFDNVDLNSVSNLFNSNAGGNSGEIILSDTNISIAGDYIVGNPVSLTCSIFLNRVSDKSAATSILFNTGTTGTPSFYIRDSIVSHFNSDNYMKGVFEVINSTVKGALYVDNSLTSGIYGSILNDTVTVAAGSTLDVGNCVVYTAALNSFSVAGDLILSNTVINTAASYAIVGNGNLKINGVSFSDNSNIDSNITVLTLGLNQSSSIKSEIYNTSVAAANLKISGTTIEGDGSDVNVGITLTPKGAGDLTLDGIKWPQADGTINQRLYTNGSGQLAWTSDGGGDVVGPASSTDEALARFDLATGKLLQNSTVLLTDAGALSGITTATVTTLATDVAAANLEITGITISGAGSDTNVGITLTPKAAGDLTLDGLKWPQADGTVGQVLKTDGAAQLSWETPSSASLSKYVVDSSGGTPYATIQSALDAANSDGGDATVFVRNGTYTENLTLYNSVYIKSASAFKAYALDGNVVISGTHTLPAGVLDISFQGIDFVSAGNLLNSDAGGNSGEISLVDCNISISGFYIVDNVTSLTCSMYLTRVYDRSVSSSALHGNTSGIPSFYIRDSFVGKFNVTSYIKGVFGCVNSTLRGKLDMSNPSPAGIYGSIINDTITVNTGSTLDISSCVAWTSTHEFLIMSGTADVTLSNISISAAIAYSVTGTGNLNISNVSIIGTSLINPTLTVVNNSLSISNSVNANTITTTPDAAALKISATTIEGYGTDSNIGITLTPKGAGDLTLDGIKWPQADGTINQRLYTNGSGQLAWTSDGGGDVVGPASSTDNAVARYDLATGKLLQDSSVLIDDSNNVSGMVTATATTFSTDVAAAKLEIAGTNITAAGSDSNVDVSILSKGTGGIKFDGISSGYASSELYTKQVGVQTTDATVTDLVTIAITAGEMLTVEARINCFIADYSACAGFRVFATFRRSTAGNVTLINSIVDEQSDAGISTVAVTAVADTGAQEATLTVTGIAGTTFNWVATYNYHKTLTSA